MALNVGFKNGTVTDVETLCPRGKYCPRFLATLHVLYYEVRQGRAGVNLRGGQISCTVQSYANSLYWKFLRLSRIEFLLLFKGTVLFRITVEAAESR